MTVATVPAYGLTCPTEESAFASLERVLGRDAATGVWSRAVAEAGLDEAPRPLTVEQIGRIADRLAAETGIPGVLGVALKVRVDTFACLARKGNAGR